MQIIPGTNDFIERQYNLAWHGSGLLFYMFVLLGPLFVFVTYGLALLVWVPAICFLYVEHFNMIRIECVNNDHLIASYRGSKKMLRIENDEIKIIIEFMPYSDDEHALTIITTHHNIARRVFHAFIPAGQGIMTHLKSQGVTVRNFWFWQE